MGLRELFIDNLIFTEYALKQTKHGYDLSHKHDQTDMTTARRVDV